MFRLLFLPLAAAASDEEVQDIVRKLRRQLGYLEPRKIEPREPGPLGEFVYDVLEAIANAYTWVMDIGWRFLLPALVLVILFLIYLSVRKVRRKRTLSLADSPEEETGRPNIPAKVFDKTADQWYSDALSAQQAQDFNTATIALYRSSLARCLDSREISRQLCNREIAWKLKGEKKECFTDLYRNSDSVVFGSRNITEDRFSSLHSFYRKVF